MAEYGFNGLFDAFDTLATERSADLLGQPLHEARYLGPELVYQFTDKGKLEAVKLADGRWLAQFFSHA